MTQPLVVPGTGEALAIVAGAVAAGDIAVIPTDTVYGLAARPRSETVRKLFVAKGRPETRPIPMLVAAPSEVRQLVAEWPVAARVLTQCFWPGALTVIVAARAHVPVEITAGTGTVGIRLPASAIAQRIISLAGGCLAVTSANRSGGPPATTVAEALASLGDHVPWFVDGGTLESRVPSTVVRVSSNQVNIMRRGAIAAAALRQALHAVANVSIVDNEAN